MGSALGRLDWGRPRQLLHPPYVADISVALLSAFIALALAGLLVAAILRRRLSRTHHEGRRNWPLGFVAVAGSGAATWGGLYSGAVENAIPVFDWAFFAVPVGLATLIEGRSGSGQRPLVTALLVAVPIAAVSAFGWSIYDSSRPGLITTAISGGIGLLFGLSPVLFCGKPTATPPAG